MKTWLKESGLREVLTRDDADSWSHQAVGTAEGRSRGLLWVPLHEEAET